MENGFVPLDMGYFAVSFRFREFIIACSLSQTHTHTHRQGLTQFDCVGLFVIDVKRCRRVHRDENCKVQFLQVRRFPLKMLISIWIGITGSSSKMQWAAGNRFISAQSDCRVQLVCHQFLWYDKHRYGAIRYNSSIRLLRMQFTCKHQLSLSHSFS